MIWRSLNKVNCKRYTYRSNWRQSILVGHVRIMKYEITHATVYQTPKSAPPQTLGTQIIPLMHNLWSFERLEKFEFSSLISKLCSVSLQYNIAQSQEIE